MKISGNTVLITGGATGIGFSLAEQLIKSDNEVIICGRRKNILVEAKNKLPQIHTKVCDVSIPKDRGLLYHWVVSEFTSVNMLINNAGVQRMIDLRKGIKELTKNENEIGINLSATIYLSSYFIPYFMKQKETAIINISSGLAFVPLAVVPIYCATKAAIHSFSMSLRHQLKDTSIKVFEIIPPTVDTDLDKGARERRGQTDRGIQPSEVAISALKAIENNEFECAIGMAKNLIMGARNNPEQLFNNMNR